MKRYAPSGGFGGASYSQPAKKKKGPKNFYVVRVGRKPGIYDNWKECEAQVSGYSGAKYEVFYTLSEAQHYMDGAAFSAGHLPPSLPAPSSSMASYSAAGAPKKYYAVAVGRKPGIYYTWGEAEPCIRGGRSIHKSFKTLQEAQQFIIQNGTPETCQTLGLTFSSGQQTRQMQQALARENPAEPTWEERTAHPTRREQPAQYQIPAEQARGQRSDWQRQQRQYESPAAQIHEERLARQAEHDQLYTGAAFRPVEVPDRQFISETTAKPVPKQSIAGPDEGMIKIYTDGSSLGNGKPGSRAGLGVYFGPGDERNLAERLPGMPQTNQRAELMAMLRAMERVSSTQGIEIWTDSQYSINCVTKWVSDWERKDWKNSKGKDVSNQDIIRNLMAKIRERKAAGADTRFQWVKGHATDPGNHEADNLANIGSRLPEVL
ncbi:ribonuclease h1 [Fusarium longipes]|uniref:Ribonuclease H n=1 Tax=Fusarium longipes TaxID=694270 RepID=A0A395S6H8_9HYPO|nr:ribonuclease h1 [Fusarium longipes]